MGLGGRELAAAIDQFGLVPNTPILGSVQARAGGRKKLLICDELGFGLPEPLNCLGERALGDLELRGRIGER